MSKKITAKELARRNAEFNALPPMKKRVAVAKEVLMMLKAETFWASNNDIGGIVGRWVENDQPLQPILMMDGIVCEGCAKGAAVVARARLGNEVNGGVARNATRATHEVFGQQLGDLLEVLFEGWVLDKGDHKDLGMNGTAAQLNAVIKYRDQLPSDPDTRLRVLYQNFVTNRGRFVIGKYKW